MARYFAPIAVLRPGVDDNYRSEIFEIVPRKWDVSTFDWAELASSHNIHLPWTAAAAMLQSCNMEIAIEADSREGAASALRMFHAMLYVQGVHPFTVQMFSDYSINQYAGINSRKSKHGRSMLHEGLREGITSADTTVSVWPAPYASMTHLRHAQLHNELTPDIFDAATTSYADWRSIGGQNSICSLLEDVLLTAPAIPQKEQSLLHIWTGLEALFPQVQTEVSFRIALYLAQLQQGINSRRPLVFERARRSYQDRSRVAHGSKPKKKGDYDPWLASRTLLLDSVRAILLRGGVPSEEDLIKELLDITEAPSEDS